MIGSDHFGFSISGAAAEFFVAKESWLHRLPDNLSWTQGALVEPFSCGYYATVRADNLDASDTVLVLGAGPIGLGVVAAAAGKGRPGARRRAVRTPAGSWLAPSAPTTCSTRRIRGFSTQVQRCDRRRGRRAWCSRPAASRPRWPRRSRWPAFRARLVYIGIDVGGRAPAALGLIQSKELQIRGIIGSPGVWPQTLRFLSRSGVDLSPLVTSTVPLARADEAIQTVLGDKTQVKVHITSTPRSDEAAVMRAGVLHAPGDLRVEDRAGPDVRNGRSHHQGDLQRAVRYRRHGVHQGTR